MRIFRQFPEALGEIKRELKEMGIRVHSQTFQDQYVGDDPAFASLELQNYGYVVSQPKLEDLKPTQPWADAEFEDRVSGLNLNPGKAWKLRPEVWEPFMENGVGFSYTYAQRLAGEFPVMPTQIERLISNMSRFPDNRNHLLTIWEAADLGRVGGHRVPCSISYHFLKREGKLLMTYQQRSADFVTHFENDIYLAHKLQRWVAEQLDWEVGRYTHFVGSLHVFQHDVAEAF